MRAARILILVSGLCFGVGWILGRTVPGYIVWNAGNLLLIVGLVVWFIDRRRHRTSA
jgi:hypothetical protein